MPIMKKLMLLVAVVALLAIATVGGKVASDRYHEHQKQKQAQAVPTVTKSFADRQVQNVKTAAAGEYQSLVAQYNNQTTECQKGLAAYALLTPAQKAKLTAPVCLAAQ